MKIYIMLCLLHVVLGWGKTRRNNELTSIEYFTKTNRNITIPVMMHFDKELTNKLLKEYKFKTRSKLKLISRNILREVEKSFHRLALKQKLKFQLLDTRFLKNKTEKVKMSDDASKYLMSYCKWQGERKMLKKKWYYSVMITGLDLYYLQKGKAVRSSTGRGYMGGMCSLFNSCTLLEWKPRNIGYLLAHEIGHSLGMTHDNLYHCKLNQHIMTARYDPLRLPKTWSHCSRRDLEHYIKSKKAWCLRGSRNGNFGV